MKKCAVVVGLFLWSVGSAFGLQLAASIGRGAVITNINYAAWSTATVSKSGSASGSIVISNRVVGVKYIGEVASATQVGGVGSVQYWVPATTYLGAVISNTPPRTDVIALEGGLLAANRLEFSEPVMDPILLILSLGQATIPVTYAFDSPFEILSQGPGYWGEGKLDREGDQTLVGYEGNGAIRFPGLFRSLSWEVPNGEAWHGFTLGVTVSGSDRVGVPDDGSGLVLLGGVGLMWVMVGQLRRRMGSV